MDQVQETADQAALTFNATRRRFAGLLVVNALLTLVTLGIYRFWAKTNIRRFFWRNVSFLDDPLEYTGTGGELFVGFLIVIAVLFPLGLVYGAINTLVPPHHPEMHVALEVLYYVVLFALLQIGFYRMWRYRMSRTRWRGVRFGLDGSTWSYLKLAAGWTVLTVLTLGLAYPFMQIDLWRYQVRHTRLGDLAFRFEGSARTLLPAWAPVFAAILINAGFALWAVMEFGFGTRVDFNSLDTAQRDAVAIVGGLILLTDALGLFGFMFYRVRQARLQIGGLRLGEASFRSRLPFWWLFLVGVICIIMILAAFAALLGVFAPSLIGAGQQLRYGGPADARMISDLTGFAVAGFVTLVLLIPFVWTLIFRFEIVKQLVKTTTVDNPHVLEHAVQTASTGPRTGEGLADALDIGGF
ncbi:MAG: DUF898 domain-containing protein [Rhodospirillales bacterium]|nr:DUF898 domain-containing protein [Rhodospirillales bacterium]